MQEEVIPRGIIEEISDHSKWEVSDQSVEIQRAALLSKKDHYGTFPMYFVLRHEGHIIPFQANLKFTEGCESAAIIVRKVSGFNFNNTHRLPDSVGNGFGINLPQIVELIISSFSKLRFSTFLIDAVLNDVVWIKHAHSSPQDIVDLNFKVGELIEDDNIHTMNLRQSEGEKT
jgi:hypothetical protein